MAGNSRDEILRFVYEIAGQEGLDQLTAALAKAGEQGGEAGEKLKQSAEDVGALLERARDVEALQALQEKLAGVDDKLAAAREGLAQLNATFSDTDKSSAGVAAQFDAARKAVADLADEHDRLAVRVSTAQAALNVAGVDTRNLGQAHADLTEKAKSAAESLAQTAAEANRGGLHFAGLKEFVLSTGESLKTAGEHALEFGKKLLEISGIAGVVGSALATISGFRFFERGVEEARSGEVALAKLKAAVDGNAESFEKLKSAAEHAAEEVGTTSNEAVNTLTKLTASLGSADAAAKALPATLTLGKAAQIDFNEAAELVATTLKSFGLEASHAGEVADKLAAIAARTGVNLADLARGAAQIAPLAKDARVGFDGVAAALAELSSKGFDAQKSNAALRELFLALSTPTSKLRQDLVGLGIDTSSLGSILDGLRKAGDRGTEALQQLSAKGRAGIAALVQGGSAELLQFQQVLESSAGSASKTAKLLSDTYDGALKTIGRTIDSLAEDTVKEALPAVETEIRKLNDELKEVGKTDAFAKIKESVKDFVAAAVKAFDEFVHTVDWKALGATIGEWATSLRDSLKGVGESATTLGKIFGGIGDVVSGLWNVVKVVFTSVESATSAVMSGITAAIGHAYTMLGAFSADAKKKAEEWYALSKQYADNAKQQWADGDAAADNAAKSLGNLIDRIASAGDASEQAAPKHSEYAKALSEAELAALNAARALVGLPPVLQTSGDAAGAAGPQLRSLADDLHIVHDAAGPVLTATANVETAFHNLGITSQTKLAEAATAAKNAFDLIDKSAANTAAGLADRQAAFLDYAKKVLAATQNLSEGERDAAQAMLAAQAAGLNLTNTLQALIQASNGASIAAQEAGKGFLLGVQQAQAGAKLQQQQMAEGEKQSQTYADAMGRVRDESNSLADRTKALGEAMASASNDTEKQSVASEKANVRMESGTNIAAQLANNMEKVRQEFAATSDAAAHFFDAAVGGALEAQSIMKAFGATSTDTRTELEKMREAAAADVVGLLKYQYAVAKAQEETRAAIDEQRKTLANTVSAFDSYGVASEKNFGAAAAGAEKTLAYLQAQKKALADNALGLDLLGKQDLAQLQQALDAAIARTQALANAAKAANDQYKSLAQSVHDALLQEEGNQAALEDERHKKLLADLEAAAKAANQFNSQSYQQAVDEENRLHAMKMKHIADQQAAQKSSASTASTSSSPGAPVASSSQSGGTSSSASSGTQGSAITVRHELAINGSNLGAINLEDPRDQRRLQDFFIQFLRNAQRTAGH